MGQGQKLGISDYGWIRFGVRVKGGHCKHHAILINGEQVISGSELSRQAA